GITRRRRTRNTRLQACFPRDQSCQAAVPPVGTRLATSTAGGPVADARGVGMGVHKVTVAPRDVVVELMGTARGFGAVLGTLLVMGHRVSEQPARTFTPDPAAALVSWGGRLLALLRVAVGVAVEQGTDNVAMLVLLV